MSSKKTASSSFYAHDIYLAICNDCRYNGGHGIYKKIENGILWIITLYAGISNFKYTFINKLKKTKNNIITDCNNKNGIHHYEYESIYDLGYDVGDTFKIKAADYNPGIIKYIGCIDDKQNVFGVSLNLWPSDGTDGNFNGTKYFDSPQNKGLFLYTDNKNHNGNGFILFGPKLDKNRMIKDNVKYCTQFELKNGIIDIEILSTKNRKNSKCLFEIKSNDTLSLRVRNLRINDRVKLHRGIEGIVKYIGDVSWTQGEIIGIELDENKVIGTSMWRRRYFRRTEINTIFGKKEIINHQQFILELDIKNIKVNILDSCDIHNKWSIDLNYNDIMNGRIVFYLRGGANIHIIDQWWQRY